MRRVGLTIDVYSFFFIVYAAFVVQSSTHLWRVHNIILTAGEQNTVNTPHIHKLSMRFWFSLRFLQGNIPVKYMVVRASLPTRKVLIIYAACTKQLSFVSALAAWLINRWGPGRRKCIVERLSWCNLYVFAVTLIDYTISFQNTYLNFYAYCFMFECWLSKLVSIKENYWRNLFFPFSNDIKLLTISDSVFVFLYRSCDE